MLTLISFILILLPIVVVHEVGHFIFARLYNVRVYEMGIGFPPRLWRVFKRGDTEYTLNLLPLGAFVRLDESYDDPRGLNALHPSKRIMLLLGGALANFVFGLLILCAAYWFFANEPVAYQAKIVSIKQESLAERIGLAVGDEIISINGISIDRDNTYGNDIRSLILANIGKNAVIEVKRQAENGEWQTVRLKAYIDESVSPNAPLGVTMVYHVTATRPAYHSLDKAIAATFADLGKMFNSIFRRAAEDPRDNRLVGPIGISQLGANLLSQATTVGVFPFLRLTGIVSILVGISNLLPIPALDGGRIMITILESIIRRRIPQTVLLYLHTAGWMLLAIVFVLATLSDIANPLIMR